MAERVAGAWPLSFDIARSQSGLRIATTAAPVTASDIERTLAEVQAERLLQGATSKHSAMAASWRSAAARALALRKLGKL